MTGFPIDALLDLIGEQPTSRLAAAIGVQPRTVTRWRRTGYIPARSADTVAVRLGHHPAEIWPNEWRQLT